MDANDIFWTEHGSTLYNVAREVDRMRELRDGQCVGDELYYNAADASVNALLRCLADLHVQRTIIRDQLNKP